MVHALRVLRHHLLGVRRPQPFGCWTAWTDFDLADRQLGDRVEQNEATSEKDARPMARGDRGPRFDVTRLPGSRKTTDPLSRGSCAGGDGPAASTGDPDPESRQELFSRLGRDVPTPALPASIRVGWANTRRSAAAAFVNVQGGIANPSTPLCGWWSWIRSRRCQRTKAERGRRGPRKLVHPLPFCRRGAAGWFGWTGSPGVRLRRPGSTRSRTTSTCYPAT